MIPPQNRFLRSPNPPHLRSSLRSCFGALFCLGAFLSFFFGALSEAQAHCCCFFARGGRFFGAWEDQYVNENLEGFGSFFLFWERFWGLGSVLLALRTLHGPQRWSWDGSGVLFWGRFWPSSSPPKHAQHNHGSVESGVALDGDCSLIVLFYIY